MLDWKSGLAGSVSSRIYFAVKTGLFTGSGLKSTNIVLKELKDMVPSIRYMYSAAKPYMQIYTFVDEYFNISSRQVYGKSGLVTGILIVDYGNEKYYPIDWSSFKQRLVTYAS